MRQRTASRQKTKVNQIGYLCEAHEKILLVIDILLRDKPDNCIIFCNTRECVDFVGKYLQRCGFIAPASRTQRSVTVAGDEASRGKRERYSCVINFDVPLGLRDYGARLGVLAQGTSNRCISLLCDYYSDFAPPIIARHRLHCVWPPCDLTDYRLPTPAQVNDWLGQRQQPPSKRNQHAEQEQPRAKRTRRGRAVERRPEAALNYASRKADQIVAAKSQRKSIWERILSFLTR